MLFIHEFSSMLKVFVFVGLFPILTYGLALLADKI